MPETTGITVYELSTGRPVAHLATEGMVTGWSFAADRSIVFVDEGYVRLWNIDSPEENRPISRNAPFSAADRVSTVAGPDGTSVFGVARSRTAGQPGDTSMRVWNVVSGEQFATVETGLGGVTEIALVDEGRHIVVITYAGWVGRYPVFSEPDAELCAKTTTPLSEQEWRTWVSPDIPYPRLCT